MQKKNLTKNLSNFCVDFTQATQILHKHLLCAQMTSECYKYPPEDQSVWKITRTQQNFPIYLLHKNISKSSGKKKKKYIYIFKKKKIEYILKA